MSPKTKTTTRRDWLRTTARTAALGALGGGAALLLAQNARIRTGNCPRAQACSGCPILDHCTLPNRPTAESEESVNHE